MVKSKVTSDAELKKIARSCNKQAMASVFTFKGVGRSGRYELLQGWVS